MAERRVVEEAPIAFLATPDGGWSEAIEPDAAGGGRAQARYRCRRCLAIFAAPAPLPRSWYA